MTLAHARMARCRDVSERVVVPDGATAYVAHPEHGYMGVGPGVYEVRRQREMADVIRVVAD